MEHNIPGYYTGPELVTARGVVPMSGQALHPMRLCAENSSNYGSAARAPLSVAQDGLSVVGREEDAGRLVSAGMWLPPAYRSEWDDDE